MFHITRRTFFRRLRLRRRHGRAGVAADGRFRPAQQPAPRNPLAARPPHLSGQGEASFTCSWLGRRANSELSITAAAQPAGRPADSA